MKLTKKMCSCSSHRSEGAAERAAPNARSEHGSLTAFTAVVGLALFALAALVVDGGRAVAAHATAVNEAAEAARVGAGQLSVTALRAGKVVIDAPAAVRASEQYLAQLNISGTTSVSIVGQTVTVKIHAADPTVMLGIVGINSLPVDGTASAVDVHGVTRAD